MEENDEKNKLYIDNIGFALIGVSGLILIYLLIYRYVNKKQILTRSRLDRYLPQFILISQLQLIY